MRQVLVDLLRRDRELSPIPMRARGVLEQGGLWYPDTLVGTDSHTTMVNGLSVLDWGVGGIEAEAAMLGQPLSMLIPEVVGFKLTGALREGDELVVGRLGLAKRNVVAQFAEEQAAKNSYEDNLQLAKQLSKNDPKIVASVVKDWVNKE